MRSSVRKWWVFGVLLAAVLSIVAPVSAQEVPLQPDDPAADPAPAPDVDTAAAVAQLEQTLAGAQVATDDNTGLVSFIGAPAGQALTGARGSSEATARGLLDLAAPALGLRDAGVQLVATTTVPSQSGGETVRFEQRHQGVPVFGGEATVQIGADGQTRSLVAAIEPGLGIDVEPTVSPADAAQAAVGVTTRAHPDAGPLTPGEPTLTIYDPELLGWPGVPGARLVWQVEVTGLEGEPVRELVLIDATSGVGVLNFNQIAHAKNRATCDANNVVGAWNRCGGALPVARTEAGPASGVAEVNTAHDYAGHTYDFFWTRFGRDSLNGSGMTLYSTVRHCESGFTCPYANAFWSGAQMHYGQGYAAADDVVGHELGHGVTQYTAGLHYYYQSGAINEALSDIYGEFVDLTNGAGNDTAGVKWLQGEDLPIGAIRDMKNPPASDQPDRMQSPLYWGSSTDSGGVHFNSGVANKAAYLMTDGGTFNGQTITALGLDKTALIWYEVATNFLTSGSDYGVLDLALVQACNNLIGTAGITAGNCTEVSQVTDATEMHLPPTVAGATAEAPVCPAGKEPTYLYSEDVEGSMNWLVNNGNWSITAGYATSGVKSLYGANPAVVSDHSVYMNFNVALPPGAEVYARWNHAFDFEPGAWDGGQVLYSTNNGSTWTNAGPLITHNGYTGTVQSGFNNPIAGQSAFVNRSLGYTSTRANLTSLAGSNVRLRFRVGSDSTQDWVGWFIDDVQIYTCAAAPARLRVTTNPGLPADIFVDGVHRDSWGLNWVEFPPGNHEVCFGELPGYSKPGCQIVNMTAGNTSEVVGNYTQNGFLRVITSPALPSTISVDGIARNDWGLWTEVTPGIYTVCYGAVQGFNVPSCQDVQVVAGGTATVTGTFTANPAAPGPGGTFGYLRVTTDPAVGAMIYVDGHARDNWGLNWVKLPVGGHQVCFGDAPNTTKPSSCQNISISNGNTTTVTGTYAPKGFLRVVTSPSVPATISIGGQTANAYGVWTAKAPGNYDVCFGPVPGYTTPPCQNNQAVTAGNTKTVTGVYTPL